MKGYDACCASEDEHFPECGPQHVLSFPRVMGPLSPTCSTFGSEGNSKLPANPYEILQIRRDATATEIRQSYKRLALWYHPGRKQAQDVTPQERKRRYQFFNLLAACYETLINMDSRRRYDSICRNLEQAKLQAGVRGAMFVGGKPLLGNPTSMSYDVPHKVVSFGGSSIATSNYPFRDRGQNGDRDHIPSLSRASSGSSASVEDADRTEYDEVQSSCCAMSQSTATSARSHTRRTAGGNSRIVAAATITSNRSLAARASLADSSSAEEEEDEPEAHFTESTTQRLFGGPLSHLFKARNFEPFSDPFDVFERVFGSQPFRRISRQEIGQAYGNDSLVTSGSPIGAAPESPSSSRSPAGWKGESQVSPDGKTTVFTTTRVLHDRLLKRTETITRVAPNKTETHVSVTAEPLTPNSQGTPANDEADATPTNICLICGQGTPAAPQEVEYVNSPPLQEKHGMCRNVCGNFCEVYHNAWNGLYFSDNGFFQEWQNMFPDLFSVTSTGLSEEPV